MAGDARTNRPSVAKGLVPNVSDSFGDDKKKVETKGKMKKKTLGSVLKDRREFLRLTQRELAAKLGVKASHVAYLENGRRRPSLSLLRRLSTVMGLDSETIFLLAHPEARELITPRDGISAKRPENARNTTRDNADSADRSRNK